MQKLHCFRSVWQITAMLRVLVGFFLMSAVCCQLVEQSKQECQFSNDCPSDECCAAPYVDLNFRCCVQKPRLHDPCSPSLLPGVSRSCPCSLGLTCKLSHDTNTYRCEPVPRVEDEREWNN